MIERIIWGEIIWRVIIRGKNIQTPIFRIAILLEAIDGGGGGDNYPEGNYPWGQLSGEQFSWGAIVREDNCPSGNYPGDNNAGGNCPGDNYLQGNCPRTLFAFQTHRLV